MKKLIKEFKEFIARGNVMDLAVAMIIGAAFTAIVSSLVNDIVMPFLGWLIGGMDFTAYVLQLGEASINYGTFIQNIINFLCIALVVFLMVKGLNKLKKKKEEEPKPDPEPSDEVKLLTEIRDALKAEEK